jgi:protein-S-isoprenylcysteine O-methyltransferase Ste14
MPDWAAALYGLSERALPDAAGRGGIRLNRVIDLHKGLTGPLVLALMAAFGVWTTAAWIYLALHGSYGVVWVLKDVTLPDRKWQRRVTWPAAAAAWIFLTHYWVAPALLVLGSAGALDLGEWSPASSPVLAAAVAVYAVGLVLMLGADVQKNLTLGLRDRGEGGGGLIESGFFARARHPNYLGEMMVYGAFALVVGHWLPWVILVAVWALVFVPNMLAIEASVSRHPGYDDWRDRTGFLLPRLGARRVKGDR